MIQRTTSHISKAWQVHGFRSIDLVADPSESEVDSEEKATMR